MFGYDSILVVIIVCIFSFLFRTCSLQTPCSLVGTSSVATMTTMAMHQQRLPTLTNQRGGTCLTSTIPRYLRAIGMWV